MTKTTRIVCLCILGAAIYLSNRNAEKQRGLGKLGIMGNLSKQHRIYNTQNTQPHIITKNILFFCYSFFFY